LATAVDREEHHRLVTAHLSAQVADLNAQAQALLSQRDSFLSQISEGQASLETAVSALSEAQSGEVELRAAKAAAEAAADGLRARIRALEVELAAARDAAAAAAGGQTAGAAAAAADGRVTEAIAGAESARLRSEREAEAWRARATELEAANRKQKDELGAIARELARLRTQARERADATPGDAKVGAVGVDVDELRTDARLAEEHAAQLRAQLTAAQSALLKSEHERAQMQSVLDLPRKK
jgi:chromosome segregation ATPase